MSGPQVRLHPDGRAVVRVWQDERVLRPWLAVGAPDGFLGVETYTDEDAADWPEYEAPR